MACPGYLERAARRQRTSLLPPKLTPTPRPSRYQAITRGPCPLVSRRDRDRFIRARRAGRIERNLRFLLAILNWAARSRDRERAVAMR